MLRTLGYLVAGGLGLWLGARMLMADPTFAAEAPGAWAGDYRVTSATVGACGQEGTREASLEGVRWLIESQTSGIHLRRGDLGPSAPASSQPGTVREAAVRAATLRRDGSNWSGGERFSTTAPVDGAGEGLEAGPRTRCQATAVQTRLERAGERVVVYRRVHQATADETKSCLDQPMTCRLEMLLELDPTP